MPIQYIRTHTLYIHDLVNGKYLVWIPTYASCHAELCATLETVELIY